MNWLLNNQNGCLTTERSAAAAAAMYLTGSVGKLTTHLLTECPTIQIRALTTCKQAVSHCMHH